MMDDQKKYSGFMTMTCEACGAEREFYVKSEITHMECPCGHRTRLFDLLPLYAECKCGKRWKYLTNRTEMQITVHCINCGAPIDTEINARGTAFVNIANRPAPKQKK